MPAISGALAVGLGVAGSIGGGLLAQHGASQQAQAAERASREAIAEQRRQFDITRQTLQPWVSAGSQAVQRLAFLLGLGPYSTTGGGTPGGAPAGGLPVRIPESPIGRRPNIPPQFGGPISPEDFPNIPQPGQPATGTPPGTPEGPPADYGSLMRDFSMADFQADPGYAFRLAEGQRALERSAAARGGLFGGGTLRALTRYGQEAGSQEYVNAYNRFQQNRATRYNFLASLAGLGQVSAGELAGAQGRLGSDVANLIVGGQTSAAAARASGYGALGSAIGNIPANWYLLSQIGRR